MLHIFHLIIIVVYGILACVLGSVYCLFSPRNPERMAIFGYMFDRLAPLFSLRVECRKPTDAESYGNAIYIANRQNNYDMMAASNIVQPPAMTVSKKSLLWIPFFGQLYWLTGNLLTDRNDHTKAHDTIAEIVNRFKKHRISIWIFPEGTRDRDRGLLPFGTETFHAAIAAGVPIVPMYVSTASNKINLNRLRSGLMVVEMLSPIDVSQYGKDQIRKLTAHYRSIMEQKIVELNKEVVECEAAGKV